MYAANFSRKTNIQTFDLQDIDDATRRAIIITSAVIQGLAKRFIPITDTILIQGYEWAVDHVHDSGGALKELFSDDLGNRLAIAAASWVNL
jgi:exosome complex component RRP4